MVLPTQPIDSSKNSTGLRNVDAELRQAVDALTANDLDFWTFRRGTARAGHYALYQYPAMMVPDMPRVFLDIVLQVQGAAVKRVLDPFAGSGTVLREGMVHGLDVTGLDINPLAILLSEVKAGPLRVDELEDRIAEVLHHARSDRGSSIEVDFPGRDKWFRHEVSVGLSRLHRAIAALPDRWVRRLMWITLAETVRLTSNSRTSTYKLHIRPAAEISASERDPLAVFARMSARTVEQISNLRSELSVRNLLRRGEYKHGFEVRLQDSAQGVLRSKRSRIQYDVVLTSPPYGDNTSTVPYGQSSFLPLQWIDLQDIGDGTIDHSCLRTTAEIDRRSLGGRSARAWDELHAKLRDLSPAFDEVCSRLSSEPPDRVQRIIRFFDDFQFAVANIARSVRSNGYMIWTVGNRQVGGQEVPFDRVLTDFFNRCGADLVHSVDRNIVGKRMATRNAIASTMGTEKILFFRKRE